MLKGKMNGGGGGSAKAAKVEKKIQKMADKETKRLAKDIPVAKKVAGNERYQAKVNSLREKAAQKSDKASKADKPISLTKTLRGIEKAKPEKPMPKRTQAPLNSGVGASPVREGLSALDKFDKRIKVRKVEKEAKPAARAYNARIKAKK